MNEFNNGYQEDTNEKSNASINETSQPEYNDTYYNESYSKNYSEYEEPKKEVPWKVIGIIVGAILFIILLIYFLFSGNSGNGDKEYTELVVNLCDKALEYEKNNEGIIDKDTPGVTAYVSLQKLVDAYLISSEQIKDPRYKTSIFGKSEFKQYIPFSAYLRLAVASNGEVYCEGLVDTSDDETAPILTLNGQDTITIAKGTNFTDPGAKAVDDIDGDLTDKITRSGTVDTNKVGEYTIVYRVTDAKGNSTTVERKIIVKEYKDLEETLASNLDSITPQIEIKGRNPYCLKLGDKYVEPGVVAIDNVDGDITNRIVVDNKATGERLGTFRVTYRVEDNAGNTAIAYRTVEVKNDCSAAVPPTDNTQINTKPTISLIGGTSIVWNKGEAYIDRGATAWDKEDGDITSKIKVDSSAVNVNAGGIYTVYYEVTDSKGLKGTAERKVTVKDPNAASNVAHFDSIPPSIRVALGNPQSIPVPTAKDSNGTVLQVTVTITDSTGAVVPAIDFYKAGVYKITYTAKPTNGVSQSVSRTVTVYDTVAPTLNVPTEMSVVNRSKNCNITEEDLFNAGVTVSDGTNNIKPTLVITGGENKACTTNTTGFDIKVYALDSDGNKSEEKTIKVKVIQGTTGDVSVSNVVIGNCGTNNQTKMYVGGKLQLSNIVYPINAVNKDVVWTTNNNTIATVENGLVTAVGKGMVDIKVRTIDEGKEAVCTIIVEEVVQIVVVESVEISGCESGSMTLTKGSGKTLTGIVKPETATNKKVTWTSSNNNVATITSSGVVKGVELGTSTITVTTEDGNKTKTCTVNVVENTTTDTTAPSKVVVKSNNANTTDPYNASGNWYGGVGKKEIKLIVESNDAESSISKFQVLKENGALIEEFYPYAGTPNQAEIIIKQDINEVVKIRAVNGAGLVGDLSDAILLKLDNTGPTTTFSTWIEDANKWINQSEYTIKYSATDAGIGVESYQYTHDDVKTKKAEDIKIEGTTSAVEMKFLESSGKDYVYVRAVDKLGNVGPWTVKPSYLNMDTVAPQAPTITITNNNTSRVTVSFAFADSSSPRMSGFGKYEYKLNNGDLQTIDKVDGLLFIVYGNDKYKSTETEVTNTNLKCPSNYKKCITTQSGIYYASEEKTHKVEAWSYDKAGNKSATSTIREDITLLPPLTINCDKETVEKGKDVKCTLDSSTSYSGVVLECLNNGTSIKKFTTTSSSKSITCKPTAEGTLTVKATKENYGPGETIVAVTAPASTNTPGDNGGTTNPGNNTGSTSGKMAECPKYIFAGTNATFKMDSEAKWTLPESVFGSVKKEGVKSITIPVLSSAEVQKTVTITAETADGKKATCSTTVLKNLIMECYKGSSGISNKTNIYDGDTVTCAIKQPSSDISISCSGAGQEKLVDGSTVSCVGRKTEESKLTFIAYLKYKGEVAKTAWAEFPVVEKSPEFDLTACSSGTRYMFRYDTLNIGAVPRNNQLFSSVKYSSDNSAVTINDKGNMVAGKAGSATITVTGIINGKETTKQCKVYSVAKTCMVSVSCADGFKVGADGQCYKEYPVYSCAVGSPVVSSSTYYCPNQTGGSPCAHVSAPVVVTPKNGKCIGDYGRGNVDYGAQKCASGEFLLNDKCYKEATKTYKLNTVAQSYSSTIYSCPTGRKYEKYNGSYGCIISNVSLHEEVCGRG